MLHQAEPFLQQPRMLHLRTCSCWAELLSEVERPGLQYPPLSMTSAHGRDLKKEREGTATL